MKGGAHSHVGVNKKKEEKEKRKGSHTAYSPSLLHKSGKMVTGNEMIEMSPSLKINNTSLGSGIGLSKLGQC
jgi:hypothetical protein